MKRKKLLIAPAALILSAGLWLSVSHRDLAEGETSPTFRGEAPHASGPVLTADAARERSMEDPHAAVVVSEPARERTIRPFTDRHQSQVVFESVFVVEGEKMERSRVLRTSFHFPYVQTFELLDIDASSGEETVAGYASMVADHVMVQFNPELDRSQVEAALRPLNLRLRRELSTEGLYLVEFDLSAAGQVLDVAAMLNGHAAVASVEPDFLVRTAQVQVPPPSDPRFPELWGMESIRALEAWNIRREAPNVVVAVLDTGIRYTHEDLRDNMWRNPRERANSRDDSGNGFMDDIHGADMVYNTGDPMDFQGHGTHVAGTIGAVGNNSLGVTGVAWDVQLMGVRFLDDFGYGVLSDGVRGIDYARENGAHIINNSWGYDMYSKWFWDRFARLWLGWDKTQNLSQAVWDALERCRRDGVIVVNAAGNSALNNDIFPDFPAGAILDNVVNVAALNPTGNLASFTNTGVASTHIAAPGVGILSTYVGSDNDYQSSSGTSMAAPHVAGMLALIKAEYPTASHREIVQRLLHGADHSRDIADMVQGGRRANLAGALRPSPVITRPLTETLFVDGESITFTIEASGRGILSYEWMRDGFPLGAPDAPTLTLADLGAGHEGIYSVRVTNAYGSAETRAMLRRKVGSPEIGAALGAPELFWSTTGNAPWGISGQVGPQGGVAAQSGAISHKQNSELTATVMGPASVSFWWSVSSERHYDILNFSVNGVVKASLSGEQAWRQFAVELPTGMNELKWIYRKDASGSAGADAGWVSDVVAINHVPVIVHHPGSVEILHGGTAVLSTLARGAEPLSFQWQKNGLPVLNATGPSLTLTNASMAEAGNYRVVVTNPNGSAISGIARVEVTDRPVAPRFEVQPAGVGASESETIRLVTRVAGTQPIQIQWLKDGRPMPGATSAELVLANLQLSDRGLYSVRATNAVGSQESFPAVVAVRPRPLLFSEWAHRLPAGERAANARTDASAVANLVRFALGLDSPHDRTGLPRPVVTRTWQVQVAGAAFSPQEAPVRMGLSFHRARHASGVIYRLEASDNLTDWVEVPATVELVEIVDATRERVVLREENPAPGSARFLRLRLDLE